MLYITKDKTTDFEELGYILKTKSYNQIPTIRHSKESVIGRNGNVIFEDGYNNKNIKVTLSAIDGASVGDRRISARAINEELVKSGKLVLDYEPTIYYEARILKGTSVKFNASYDEINIEFELHPIAFSRVEGLTWETADIPWELADFPWDYGNEFTVSTGGSFTVDNIGNVTASPLIIINGVGDVTFTDSLGKTFTYTGLNGIINIDSRNLIVYDDSLTNQMANYSGDFLELSVGENIIDVTGTVVGLSVIVNNKDAYI